MHALIPLFILQISAMLFDQNSYFSLYIAVFSPPLLPQPHKKWSRGVGLQITYCL